MSLYDVSFANRLNQNESFTFLSCYFAIVEFKGFLFSTGEQLEKRFYHKTIKLTKTVEDE